MIRRKVLSWHSVTTAYILGVAVVDTSEITFNLLLDLYKFQPHLRASSIDDNQLGLFFSDPVILPFVVIIFVHYSLKYSRWKMISVFTVLFTVLEWIYVRLGYLKYNNWSLIYSTIFYAAAFSVINIFLARPIASYKPPIPRAVRLICFSYMVHMWIGATFALPVFNLYQFRTGLFTNPMADDRFVDLGSGLVFGIIAALLIPRISKPLKPLVSILLTAAGISLALYTFSKGWLIYHHWNHFLMALRYFVPSYLIILYDNWEVSYESRFS